MILEQFTSIRIINLAYRKDRRAEMDGELTRVGLFDDPRISYFDAISVSDAAQFSSRGARGVYFSHLAVLEEAVETGANVLILEDDVDFSSNISHFRLPSNWQIFYGGYEASNPADLQKSDIIGAHFMGFRSDITPLLVRYLREILNSDPPPPIDGAYVWFRRAHPDVETVFAAPTLGYQRPSRTDIAELRFFDRLPILRQSAAIARKLKRRSLIAYRSPSFGLPESVLLAGGGILVAALAVWSSLK